MLHHLDGGTMRPPAGRLTNDAGRLICHVVAFETDRRRRADRHRDRRGGPARTRGRGSARSRPSSSADRDPETTVARQLERLGLGPVTDICITHLDIDHASALDEFPGRARARAPDRARRRAQAGAARAHPLPRRQLGARPRLGAVRADGRRPPRLRRRRPCSAAPSRRSGCRATAAATRATRSGTATAGSCTPATPSTTPLRSRPAQRTSRYLQVFARAAAAEPRKVADTQQRLQALAQQRRRQRRRLHARPATTL